MKLLLLCALCFAAGTWLQEDGQADEGEKPRDQEAFHLDEIVASMKASNQTWISFLERTTLETGIYRLPAGGTDRQSPHRFDEVYYVVEGKAVLEAGDESFAAQAGSILFVAADVPHRFRDIEEDLVVLVFFTRKTAPDGDSGG